MTTAVSGEASLRKALQSGDREGGGGEREPRLCMRVSRDGCARATANLSMSQG